MNSIFGQFGSSIQGAFVTALQSTDGFFVSLIDGIKRAVNEMLSLLLVTAIFNALLGGTGMGALMGLKDIGRISWYRRCFWKVCCRRNSRLFRWCRS